MNHDSKIYIAGHTGLVGSAILRCLQSQGYGNLVLKTHKELDLEIQRDVNDFFESQRPEYVFLAAAKVGGIYANNTFPADFLYNNLIIESNVIHAAHRYGVKKLLFLGSSCIYPKLAPQPMKEEYLLSGPLEPTNEPYAVAKIAGIKLCSSYNRQYGTNFISVMPTNLYGPNDNFDLETSHVLPALIRKFHLARLLSQGKFDEIVRDFRRFGNAPDFLSDSSYFGPNGCILSTAYSLVINHLSRFGIDVSSSGSGAPYSNRNVDCLLHTDYSSFNVTVSLWGTGDPYREFLHVDDLAEACVFLMQNCDYHNMGEFVNIGAGEDLKIKDLALLVRDAVGFQGQVVWDETKPDGTPKKLLDISRIRSLGWRPRIDFREGIRNMYDWYSGSLCTKPTRSTR